MIKLTILELIKLFRMNGYRLVMPSNEDIAVDHISINAPSHEKQEAEVILYTTNKNGLRQKNIFIYSDTEITYEGNDNKITILNITGRDILVVKPIKRAISISELLEQTSSK